MKLFSKICTLLTAAALTVSLAGCGQKAPETTVEAPQAVGRYVEKNLSLPESRYPLDMVLLNDGRLRVSLEREDGSAVVVTKHPENPDWEEIWEAPREILDTGSVGKLALSQDGTMFCHTWRDADETGNYSFHFFVVEPDGEIREIPIGFRDVDYKLGYLIPWCDFTQDGRLFVQNQNWEICSINLQTGEVEENINGLERIALRMDCGGNTVYIAGWETISCYDGENKMLDNAMGKRIVSSLKATEGNTPRLSYWENKDGYVFFTTHEGLYSYIPGGSVTEELVSASRTTMGNPAFLPFALAGTEDGSFFLLGSLNEGRPVLLQYGFDADIPTVGSRNLRIYSLYEDEILQQIVSEYQVAHPELTVDLEIGVTGDGGNQADVIRTLNTQILAGNGPDVLCLDGLRLESYFEKGVLADLHGLLDRAEPTLTQVTRCYEKDSKLYGIPTAFTIPAMYGPSHILSQIHDLDSLAAAAKQARQEQPSARATLPSMIPAMTADAYYDACSSGWIGKDGTVDEASLETFFAGLKKIYDLDPALREMVGDQFLAETKDEYVPGAYTGMGGSLQLIPGNFCLTAGTLDGFWHWANCLAANSELEDYVTMPMDLGTGGVFVPKRIMGILETSMNKSEAEAFLVEMLSAKAQTRGYDNGFPTNREVMEKALTEDRIIDSWLGASDADGNHVGYQAQYPSVTDRENLRSWLDAFSIPASTDWTIRNLVMEQADACLDGSVSPEDAAQETVRMLKLYLAE